MTAAGAGVGLAFAAAGAGIAVLWPAGTLPLAVGLGAIAFAYALHEAGIIRLPVPGRDWQVPADWVREGFYRSAVVFGGTLGFGVFTRVPFASLPIRRKTASSASIPSASRIRARCSAMAAESID